MKTNVDQTRAMTAVGQLLLWQYKLHPFLPGHYWVCLIKSLSSVQLGWQTFCHGSNARSSLTVDQIFLQLQTAPKHLTSVIAACSRHSSKTRKHEAKSKLESRVRLWSLKTCPLLYLSHKPVLLLRQCPPDENQVFKQLNLPGGHSHLNHHKLFWFLFVFVLLFLQKGITDTFISPQRIE